VSFGDRTVDRPNGVAVRGDEATAVKKFRTPQTEKVVNALDARAVPGAV
jgi:hypothetical protein